MLDRRTRSCRIWRPSGILHETVRAYAFDVVCLARFLEERGIDLSDLVPTDVFDWVDWQSSPRRRGGTVVSISAGHGAGASVGESFGWRRPGRSSSTW